MTGEGRGARGPPSHMVRHRVTYGETDAAGVVFYPNYLRWFDLGTHELFRSLGLPLKDLERDWEAVLPLVSVRAEFRSPLRYDDEIEVRSTLEKVSGKSLTIVHLVTRDGTEVASGQEVRGWVTKEGGTFRARTIPEEVRRRLA